MAISLSSYIDPGVYIQEVIVPGALSIATVPFRPVVIAHGSRSKRAVNEAVTRGLFEGETLTVSATPGAHDATLATLGDRRLQNTTVLADGIAVADAMLSYQPAVITGTAAGTYNLSTNNAIALEMDGKTPVTIVFVDGADAVAVSGATVTVTQSFGGISAAAATRAEVAMAINKGLFALSALGYGAAYGSATGLTGVASDATTGVRVTSPVSTPASHVRVLAAVATSATSTIFGSSTLETATVIRIANAAYISTAVYTITYVSMNDRQDGLAQPGVIDILKVGSFHSVGNFVKNIDWSQVAGTEADELLNQPSEDVLDWNNTGAGGVITGALHTSAVAGTYDVSTNDVIRLSIDGRAAVNVDLNGLGSPPHGYANPAAPAAATAAELAANINAVLAANAAYGAKYATVASNASGTLRLTSPNDGKSSSISIQHPTSLDATTAVFGLSATQTLVVTGTGARPTPGSVYFVTYSYERPAADYNNPLTFFSKDTALAFTGPIAADNPLAIAVDIAFRNNNNASSVMLIQVDDATTTGAPTRQEYLDALDASSARSTATDLVVLSTSLDTQIDLMQNVEFQSSLTEKNYRRGWFGLPRATAIGDKDTADTYVYRATQTLQVAADSPARGRLILVAPPGVEGISKTLTLEDGSTQKVDLDSTYLALAIASRMSSFTSPAEALVRKTITGFDIDEGDFTPWLKAERGLLASQGTTVVTFDAGTLKLLDPITTEAGGGGLVSFAQISASTQKDNLTRKIDQALDTNIIGIVPTDLADFIIDIKLVIANVINGEIGAGAIGPYRNDDKSTRSLDMTKDIVVEQDANDPTKFFFSYSFWLRYAALRLYGTYTVDSPFTT